MDAVITLKEISIKTLIKSIPKDLHKIIVDEIIASMSKRSQEKIYFKLNKQLNKGINKLHEHYYLIICTEDLDMLNEVNIIDLYYAHHDDYDDIFDDNSIVIDILCVGENKKTSLCVDKNGHCVFSENLF